MVKKYGEKAKVCYMDLQSFIAHGKIDDAERRFDTSNFEIDRPFPKGKYKIVIKQMKGELGG